VREATTRKRKKKKLTKKATAQKFVAESGWTVVGTAGFSAGTATYTSLALDSTGGKKSFSPGSRGPRVGGPRRQAFSPLPEASSLLQLPPSFSSSAPSFPSSPAPVSEPLGITPDVEQRPVDGEQLWTRQ